MENPTPFDLNDAIRRWQDTVSQSPAFGADNLEELASHLRASVERLTSEGMPEEAAFALAVKKMGEGKALEKEFAKVSLPVNRTWPVVLFWLAAGIYFCLIWMSLLGDYQRWRRTETVREFMGGAARGQSLTALYDHFSHPSFPSDALSIFAACVVLDLLLALGARWGAGSWSELLAVVDRRKWLGPVMALAGVVLIMMPEFLEAGRGINHVPISAYFGGECAEPAAWSLVMVLAMVLLARLGGRPDGMAARHET